MADRLGRVLGAVRNAADRVRLRVRWLATLVREQARVRRRAGSRLPPGPLDPFERGMRRDQHFALQAAARHGPVFKTVWDGQWTTCVVGLSRGRRLLTEYGSLLPGITLDLEPLFPGGALRGMAGEPHSRYRRVLRQALQAVPFASIEASARARLEDGFGSLTGASREGPVEGAGIRAALRETASAIMLRVLVGVEPGSSAFGRLTGAYRRFGPTAPVYRVAEEHAAAFREVLATFREVARGIESAPDLHPPSMLRHLVVSGTLDETALGNLAYLHEPAHFDVYSLWHWMLWYLCREQALLDRLRVDYDGTLTRAVVHETLRLNQSEVLLRRAVEDIDFEGHRMPDGSVVRVCLWESHKDPEVFPDPHRFVPDRFLGRTYEIEQYAPFGLDSRRCIGNDLVLDLGAMFTSVLARGFTCTIAGDGPPIRGPFHWEPNPAFALVVRPA